MKIRWLGNSCIEIIDNYRSILIDPNYIIEPILNIDMVLITHEHQDHIDMQKLKKLKIGKIIAPKTTLEQFDLKGIEGKPGLKINNIFILKSWCWNAKESLSYYYNGILHSGDSAKFPDIKDLKIVFTACFPNLYEDYLREFQRLKPDLIIPFHYDITQKENAVGLQELLRRNKFNCKIFNPGEKLEI
jgi:L-ascorbate metabolism protein UlaG (beta-lactamase superfamily)